MRLQVAIMGRVNAGKSSFLNLLTGQDIAVISAEPGTTTDVVEKNQELLPIGPITWLDTPGLGDNTILADKRLAKTLQIFDRADVIVLLLIPFVKWYMLSYVLLIILLNIPVTSTNICNINLNTITNIRNAIN